MARHFRFSLFLLFLCFCAKQSFAGLEPYQNFLKGQVRIGDTLSVKDEKFRNTQFNWANITNISVSNRIELKVLQEQAITQNFECQIQLRIAYYSTPQQVTPTEIQDVKLNVNYRVGEGVVHKLIDHYSFTGGHFVKIFVTGISSPQFGQQPPPILQLTNSILIDRQYKFNGTLPFTLNGSNEMERNTPKQGFFGRLLNSGSHLENNGHQLKLEWAAMQGAEEYDVEWTTIDVPGDFDALMTTMVNGTALTAQVEPLFRNNATRITTDAQSYVVSLLYNASFIAVRIRQVSYDSVTGLRDEGNWHYQQSDDSYAIWPLNWHEANLNWQFSATFAEQGKKKEVVSYFDGTLRNRQTATLSNDNTEDVAVVQENIYDEFGRPFISILPAPHRDSGPTRQYLRFFPAFNLNHNASQATSFNFKDIGNSFCGIYPLDSLSNASGAAKYYSNANTFANNSYIPDSKNYPFSMTQYTPDNTNRVQVQGGVGRIFQPGIPNNKATRYMYGKPEQWELDRIFGNDVGYAEHYLKQTVIDANGQASVSYTNASGKTIATALTGALPPNVSALSSFVDTASFTSTLLKPEQFVYDAGTKKFTASATYIATSLGSVKLRYNINKLIDLYNLGSYQLCSNCNYTLKVKVVDDCNEIKAETQTPINVGSAIANCNDTGLQTEAFNFLTNRLGEYYISFEMSISDQVVENYVANYIAKVDSLGMLEKEFKYIKPYLDSLKFKPIFNDCRNAVSRLGTRAAFMDMVKASLKELGMESTYVDGPVLNHYVDTTYTSLHAHAISLEADCNTSPCDAVENQLIADVSPGGQYALFDEQGNPLETSINILYKNFRSVFNVLDSSHANYKARLVTMEDGRVISPHDTAFTINHLAKYWIPEWGELFLNKHPEYCKVLACKATETYLSWDEKITNLYRKESDIDRISTGLQYSTSNGHWLLNYDPFFAGAGATYKPSMLLDLDEYTKRILKMDSTGFTGKNLSQYVTYSLYCADTTYRINPNRADSIDRWDNCAPIESCRSKDREWSSYRDFYLQIKQKYYDALTNSLYCNSSSAPDLACLPSPSFDFGNAGNPGTRDFAFSIDSIAGGFQHVKIRTLNGAVSGTKLIWFDPAPLKEYKSLRNYVFMPASSTETTFYLPEGMPLTSLKIKKVQSAPFNYARMHFNDYFELDTLYELEGGWEYFYGFGLKANKFPPNNAFDPYGKMASYGIGPNLPFYGWGETDLYFNPENNFYASFINVFWDDQAYVYGHIDYPVYPLDPSCPPEMANKVPRFPTGGGFAPGYSPQPAGAKAQGEEQLAELIKSSCEVNADNWMKLLEPGLNKISAGPSQRAMLKLRLIEVCKKGGSIDYPTGTSTLPGAELSSLGDASFGTAIKTALGITAYTSLLNPWVIDSPLPHGTKTQVIEKVIGSTNVDICTKINNLRPSGYSDAAFYTHLVNTYGSAMNMSQSDFDALLKSCGSCKYLISHDVRLPFLFEPGSQGCITRSQFNTAMANLSAQISGGVLQVIDGDSLTYTNIVANYMNQTFGFGLSFEQYNRFKNDASYSQLCNEAPYVASEDDPYAAVKALLAVAVTNGKSDYQIYLTEKRNSFRLRYINTCTAARPNVQLSASNQLYHYTLYYYDQADNLVRTVPPEGVKFLTANEVQEVGRYRDGTLGNCVNGPQENANKQVALQKLADVLGSGNKAAVEQWLFKANAGKQFMATTPNKDFIFNTCITGNYLNIDVYSAQADANSVTLIRSNHISANISSILPLQPWTHVVLQADNLASGTLEIYVNGSRFTGVNKPLDVGCTWQLGGDPFVLPENMGDIKHLRLYTRLMQPLEILDNANSGCKAAINSTDMTWFRFNYTPEDNVPSPIFPDHLLKTNYVYNSLNQVVKQQTPDAGLSSFFYDDLGRLTYSQNAKQAAAQKMSYTLYDMFSRVSEVGQLNEATIAGYLSPYISNYENDQAIKANTTRAQVTQTYYDESPSSLGLPLLQANLNLRKRVAASVYRDTYNASPQQISYYAYDLTGNVKTLGNYIEGLGHKRLDYEYDLISGKVNFLAYQDGQPDAFYYKYDYDAENRLVTAWSATQASYKPYGGSYLLNGRKDAEYYYYLHGPLRRVELGDDENKVQGMDYAYTLQGWLKGVNGTALAQNDMGNDGANIGKDALAFSLGYYQNDFIPIGGSANAFAHHYQHNAIDTLGRNLYNGNISHSTYAIAGINSGATVGYTYGYDQLNRIKNLRQQNLGSGGNWSFAAADHNFKENFSYDGNGNLLKLNRYNQNGNVMDSLSYGYSKDVNNRLLHNRLNQVGNAVAITGSVKATTYQYDEIGNLTYDHDEGITGIDWSVYGKIRQVNKASGNIVYKYDAAGNRISKNYNNKTTYYVRDAQGNTLAVYDKKGSNPLYWREQHLYGSSRLGVWNADINTSTGNSLTWDTIGKKRYELSNHLGNVMAVISDSRTYIGGNYVAQLIAANDYYAFGSQMAGRNYSANGAYRYGFNGKENDNEVKGEGNQQDYGMRIYDPRIGRFLSVDPLTPDYPWYTPYQFAGNTPVQAIDLDGLEEYHCTLYFNQKTGVAQLKVESVVEKRSFLGLSWKPTLKYYVQYPQGGYGDRSFTFTQYGGTTNGNTVDRLSGWLKDPSQFRNPDWSFEDPGGIKDFGQIFYSDAANDLSFVNDAYAVYIASGKGLPTRKGAVFNTPEKQKNKNSNDAEGNFMLYDVHSEPNKKGQLLKIGKADQDRTRANGDPVRMKDSERAARKAGYKNATATPRRSLGKTTTAAAKKEEAADVRSERANGNTLPLNKERDKKYKP